jgi:hypothetical protein
MRNPYLSAVVIALATTLAAAARSSPEYSLENYDKSPGIYYESKGTAVLFNTVWKIIVYVDLDKINREILTLWKYVNHIEVLCQNSVVREWTRCTYFNAEVGHGLNRISDMGVLLREVAGSNEGDEKKKRGFKCCW